MAGALELEQQFQSLFKETVARYENESLTEREKANLSVQKRHDLVEQKEAALRAMKPELKLMESIARRQEEFVKEHLQEVRPHLVDRQPLADHDTRRRALRSGFRHERIISISPYTGLLMAGDQESLTHVTGMRGNPWVLPWNPGEIRIKESRWGGGNGWCGMAQPYLQPTQAEVWFAFLADVTGVWSFIPVFDFHGFYYLAANKDWWNCIDCRVTLDAHVDVYQYYWNGQSNFSLLNVDEDGGVKYGFYDESPQLYYSTLLRADSAYYVFVRVWIDLLAHPYGPGTYGEINFQDGTANYINPVVLLAWPD